MANYTMFIQRSPVEIQTPTKWKLINRSMTNPPHELLPSSILPPPSSHYAFIPARKKFGTPFKKIKTECLKLCDLKFAKFGWGRGEGGVYSSGTVSMLRMIPAESQCTKRIPVTRQRPERWRRDRQILDKQDMDVTTVLGDIRTCL